MLVIGTYYVARAIARDVARSAREVAREDRVAAPREAARDGREKAREMVAKRRETARSLGRVGGRRRRSGRPSGCRLGARHGVGRRGAGADCVAQGRYFNMSGFFERDAKDAAIAVVLSVHGQKAARTLCTTRRRARIRGRAHLQIYCEFSAKIRVGAMS